MDEAYLKGRLCKALHKRMPGAVVIRHEDKFNKGIPDISSTWFRTTTWAEVKLDRPGRRSKVGPLQRHFLRGLAGLLVTYQVRKDGTGVVVDDVEAGRCALALDAPFSKCHAAVAELIANRTPRGAPETPGPRLDISRPAGVY